MAISNAVIGFANIRWYSPIVISQSSDLPTGDYRLNGQFVAGADFTDTITEYSFTAGNVYAFVDAQTGWIPYNGSGGGSTLLPSSTSDINTGNGTATYVSPANLLASDYGTALTTLSTLETTVSTLETAVDTLESSVSTLETTVDALELNVADVQNITSSCLITDTEKVLCEIDYVIKVTFNQTGYTPDQLIITNESGDTAAITFEGYTDLLYNGAGDDLRPYPIISNVSILVDDNDSLYLGLAGGLDDNNALTQAQTRIRVTITLETIDNIQYQMNIEVINSDGTTITCTGTTRTIGTVTADKSLFKNAKKVLEVKTIKGKDNKKITNIYFSDGKISSYFGPYPMATIQDINTINSEIDTLNADVVPATQTEIETGSGGQPMTPDVTTTAILNLNSTGGTFQSISANGLNLINDVADPVDDLDAANKQWVISEIAASGFYTQSFADILTADQTIYTFNDNLSLKYDVTFGLYVYNQSTDTQASLTFLVEYFAASTSQNGIGETITVGSLANPALVDYGNSSFYFTPTGSASFYIANVGDYMNFKNFKLYDPSTSELFTMPNCQLSMIDDGSGTVITILESVSNTLSNLDKKTMQFKKIKPANKCLQKRMIKKDAK